MKNKVDFYILSLLRPDRKSIVEKNIQKFPIIKIFESVNGYDTDLTIDSLKKTGLKYNSLFFTTYGTLANFITKYNVLKHQIQNNIKLMCFIEDDLELHDSFVEYIENKSLLFEKYDDLNMIRLDKWGEGYITSLNGAVRIVNSIKNQGICDNVDNQLRLMCGKEIGVEDTPWKLLHESNEGDCLKTEKLPKEYSKCRWRGY